MNLKKFSDSRLPTILVVQDSDDDEVESGSLLMPLFNRVQISQADNHSILVWIQQNQPALAIFKTDRSVKAIADSIVPLKLDWLTRKIPVIVIGNTLALPPLISLTCDAFLNAPYSAEDLDRVIYSLIDIPTCKIAAV